MGDELLLQAEEFKCLLFMSERRTERETDRQVGAASAEMQMLYCSVMVKGT